MSEERPVRQYSEKDEKQEKEEEKEEKGRTEKSWDEKWRRDPLNAAVWALILIWLGLVLLADNLTLFDNVKAFQPWAIFFLGAGGILFLEALFRVLVPAYRAPVGGTLVLATIFVSIGLGWLLDAWWIIGPIILIAIGVSILFRGLTRRPQ